MNNKSIFQYSPAQLIEEFTLDDAKSISKWVYQKQVFDTTKWENVPRTLKDRIFDNFHFRLPKIIWNGTSKDGTIKFLMRLEDDNTIETVMIPGNDRQTLCVSSQVGCAVGCTFCHTGTQGLTRNLQTSEIVGQLLSANSFLKESNLPLISNIVFMGQGEPLNNFTNVKRATEIFLNQDGLALSKKRITLSTSGLAKQIERWDEFPDINVAISLHASRNDLRSELMPINQIHDLERLFKAIKNIPTKNSKRISYEYLLIKNLNDGQEDIDGLIDLLPKKESKINLIPFNEYPESNFKRPSDERIKWFQSELQKQGFICTIRRTMGTDILAACGQLKSEAEKLNLW